MVVVALNVAQIEVCCVCVWLYGCALCVHCVCFVCALCAGPCVGCRVCGVRCAVCNVRSGNVEARRVQEECVNTSQYSPS